MSKGKQVARAKGIRSVLPDLAPDSTFGVIRRLFVESASQHIPGYLIAGAFMLIVAGSVALSAWIMGDVINQVFVDRNVDQIVYLAIAVIVISTARGIGTYGSTVALSIVGNKIVAGAQRRLYDHLLTLGVDYYTKNHSSELITHMSHNVQSTRTVISTVLTSVGRDFLTLVGLVAVMFIQSPIMSVVALLIGPAAILGVTSLVKRIKELAKQEFHGLARVISAMQETAHGIRIIKAFNLESIMRTRMQAAIVSVRQRADKMAKIKARISPIMETLGGLAIAAVIFSAGVASINYGMEPGAFVSFITAILLAYEPAKRLANTRVQVESGLVGARMMYKILDTKPTMNANPDGPDLVVGEGAVDFDNVSFAYRKVAPVLKHLSLHAAPGKVTALVGPSGSGKSTIMSLTERFYNVASGTITIDGQDISKVRLASLRNQLALVSQDTVLFRGTIRENIRFGRPTATDEEVEEAATNALAHDFIMATKKGYDTELEDSGASLSGGQRQRIAIARAMIRNAPIILLDEATSSLDSESEHQVQVAFDRLMVGRTTIVIAHRLSTVVGADQICVVVDGRIVEQGRHAELLAAGKQYARLYHLQFEKHASAPAGEAREQVAAE